MLIITRRALIAVVGAILQLKVPGLLTHAVASLVVEHSSGAGPVVAVPGSVAVL